MQLKDSNPHQKLQEMCDCYLDTDFAGQMAAMTASRSVDLQEDAVKYLALAIMYGVTEKARKLSIEGEKDKTGARLKTADAKIKLPPPPARLFAGIVSLVRGILHFDDKNGNSFLSMGLRNSRLDLQVKLKEKKEKTSLKIKFPELGE